MRILIGLDPAKPWAWVEGALVSFPLADQSDIIVVSALRVPCPPRTSLGPAARRLYGSAVAALHAEMRQAATQKAATLRDRLASRAWRLALRVVDAPPVHALHQAALAWRPDLILLGPTSGGRLRCALAGSVPDAVVRTASCPVLVARPRGGDLRRVLAATDGSLHAEAALRFLVGLPVPSSVQLRVSAVVEVPRSTWVTTWRERRAAKGQPLADVERTTAARALVQAGEILAALRCPVHSSLCTGNVARVLTCEVREWRPDLLVLGARGRTAAPGAALGSVAERFLLAAPCSTLFVRA